MSGSLITRIERAEAGVPDAILRNDLEKLARETGESFDYLYAESKRVSELYDGYSVLLSDGMYDIEPALRAIADGEGLDFEELKTEARRVLRRLRRAEGRRR